MLVVEQLLNGLQFGLLLFLLAAGLTLVFGIMDMINLAHGSLYMLGAFLASTFVQLTGSFLAGVLLIAILGGAQPVYKERTLTVSRPAQGSAVPTLVGQRLDVALDRLESAGLKGEFQGGGLFGVLDERDWKVVDQDPSPGARLSQGDTVHLDIDRA